MLDIREMSRADDMEEVIRVAMGAHGRQVWSNLRVKVAKDSTDGHTAVLQPVTQMQVTDQTGAVSQISLPQLLDVPISFKGGGGVSNTHPVKEGDEGTVSLASAPIDNWHAQGGVQMQIDGRSHSLSDATYHPGGRSDPRKLKQVSTDTHQVRTDDKKSVIDHGPDGTHHKVVDPSTQGASDDFDPYKQATKYHDHKLHPSDGLLSRAVDGDTTHAVSNTHGEGPKLSAKNGGTVINAHPDGAAIQAPNASLDKDSGNLTNKGTHTAGGNITSTSGNISAPAGAMSALSGSFTQGFSFGGGGGGGGGSYGGSASGDMTIRGLTVQDHVATPIVRADQWAMTKGWKLADLVAAFPPNQAANKGLRTYITDAAAGTDGAGNAVPIAFLSTLQGGGTMECPAVCLNGAWVAG